MIEEFERVRELRPEVAPPRSEVRREALHRLQAAIANERLPVTARPTAEDDVEELGRAGSGLRSPGARTTPAPKARLGHRVGVGAGWVGVAAALIAAVVVAGGAIAVLGHGRHRAGGSATEAGGAAVRGEIAANRAEALWTGYLITARPRLADTPVARAPQSASPSQAVVVALMEGRFALSNPPATPGRVHGYRIISAQRALAKLHTHTGNSLPAVRPLRATNLRLTWATFDTAAGKRRLPAWEVHTGDLREPIFVLAIRALTPPALPLLARTIDNPENETSARVSSDGMTITLRFIGAPAGDKPCDASYTAHALESDVAPVISFWITQHTVTSKNPTQPRACSLVGSWRTVTLKLAGPLGQRPLIDSRTYAPIRTATAH